MKVAPTTNVSLILRLRSKDDAEAWEEFVKIYQPTIENIAFQCGLNRSEVDDAVQQVFIHLLNVVGKWDPSHESQNFRGWLYRVARNTFLKMIRDRPPHLLTLNEEFDSTNHSHSLVESNRFDFEFCRFAMLYVAEKIKEDFDPINWNAFWQTYVDNQSIQSAAKSLNISPARIYIARSRIVARLRREIARLGLDEDSTDSTNSQNIPVALFEVMSQLRSRQEEK